MGYTLAAALDALPSSAEVIVADLIPEVVDWNRGPLGACAGRPLDDSRVVVHIGDVGELLVNHDGSYDAVLLDVDNGPEGLTHSDNNWLYSVEGTSSIYRSLTPGGVLAVPLLIAHHARKRPATPTPAAVAANQGPHSLVERLSQA